MSEQKVQPDFAKQELIPVTVQDVKSNEILMLAYTNEEAFNKTLETGYAHYYSRSRKKIWMKGESSGNVQKIVEIRLDCDNDALLYIVEQTGAACHTGHYSCFYRNIEGAKTANQIFTPEQIYDEKKILDDLYEIIEQRKKTMPEGSYVAKLLAEDESKSSLNKILEKLGEEAIETILASKDGKREDVIYEAADLIFHLFVLLSKLDISPYEIYGELKRRYKGD